MTDELQVPPGAIPSPANDRALLRRFEPVIRFTKGEPFFPIDVASYLRECSYWVQPPGQLPRRMWPEGAVTFERLTEPRSFPFGSVYYLKFIEPVNVREILFGGQDDDAPSEQFDPGKGRLARVGYGSRFVDAIFSLSLLARGRVPGDSARAAARAYRKLMGEGPVYQYYGRVLRRDGWIILQYWFFYAYNSWRSGFFGANDHEGDWEMIMVYLYRDGQELHPEWVAYASHDLEGDDLRRRWDDPELDKVGEHPVVYAGAGSHASYFRPGEYLTELELPFLAPVTNFVDRLQLFWERTVYPTAIPREERWSEFSIFRVPFIDYARGDGVVLGPAGNQENARPWNQPVLLEPPPKWVTDYKGLWGLYTRDPFSGEDAPAGPMYNRDGTVRRAWYDPLGWAGLDKVPPPNRRAIFIQRQQSELIEERQKLRRKAELLGQQLMALGVELESLQGRAYLQPQHGAKEQQAALLAAQRNELLAQIEANEGVEAALNLYQASVARGQRSAVRAHLHRAHRPYTAETMRINRFAEFWAAVSIGLLLIGFVILLLFARQYFLVGIGGLVGAIVFIEATFRGRLARLINSLTIGLAIVSALVLLYEFFWSIVIALVLTAGLYVMFENARELRRR